MTIASRRSRGVNAATIWSTTASSGSVMCTRSAPATASPGVAATFAPNASSARALASVRFQTVTASPRRSIPSTIAPPSSPVPRNATLAIADLPLESTPVLRVRRPHLLEPASARRLLSCSRFAGRIAVVRAAAAAACCAGPAIPKAARRSSRPIRRIPTSVVGFDVEIAELLARGLGRTPRVRQRHVHVDRSDHRPRRRRHRPERHRGHAGAPRDDGRHDPVLRVPRGAERPRRRRGALPTLADLRGRRVGTLGGTIAYEILLRAEREHGLRAVSYDDDVHPYSDLVLGRVDAVLLDNVLAERRHADDARLHDPAADASRSATTSACSRRPNAPLRDRINEILRGAMRDGTLERIFRKWTSGTTTSRSSTQRLLAGEPVAAGRRPRHVGAASRRCRGWEAARRYLPSLLRASVVTIVLSCLSMALAVALGVLIATGRVYGGAARCASR